MRAFVMTVSTGPSPRGGGGVVSPVRRGFPTPELHSLPIGRKIFFPRDNEVGIREAHFVADCRTEHLRISAPTHLLGHRRLPRTHQRLTSIARSPNFP